MAGEGGLEVDTAAESKVPTDNFFKFKEGDDVDLPNSTGSRQST